MLSKSFDPEDYKALDEYVHFLDDVQLVCGSPNPHQHPHRIWEYSLALQLRGHYFGKPTAVDIGCGWGVLSPALYMSGCSVTLSDIWQFGSSDHTKALDQMNRIQSHCAGRSRHGGNGPWWTFDADDLVLSDGEKYRSKFDIVYCVSTIEHMPDEERTIKALATMTKPDGAVFLTTDYAESSVDTYTMSNMRKRIYDQAGLHRLIGLGKKYGLELWRGESDYQWRGCHVHDYSFASLTFKKKGW